MPRNTEQKIIIVWIMALTFPNKYRLLELKIALAVTRFVKRNIVGEINIQI